MTSPRGRQAGDPGPRDPRPYRCPEAAAVRDLDGRTYAAASVDMPSLQVSALGVCVAMAYSSGSRGLEAVVVMGPATELSPYDAALLKEFEGDDVVVHLV